MSELFLKSFGRILECIQKMLGQIAFTISASALLLFLGTVISFAFEAVYLCFVNAIHPLFICMVIGSALLVLWFQILLFMRLTAFLASKQFLPHLYTAELTKTTITAGFIPLILAAFAQIVIYDFEYPLLCFALALSALVFITISMFAIALHFATTARREKMMGWKKGRMMMFIICLFLCVVSVGALFFIVTEYSDFSFVINLVIVIVVASVQILTRQYYSKIIEQVSVDLNNLQLMHPASVQTYVMVSKFNKPTIRAISYAKVMHPDVTILNICTKDKGELIETQWEKSGIDVQLKLFKPEKSTDYANGAIEFIKSIPLKSERDLIVIYMPHFVSRNALEGIMHNNASARLTHALEKFPNVIVCKVPWNR